MLLHWYSVPFSLPLLIFFMMAKKRGFREAKEIRAKSGKSYHPRNSDGGKSREIEWARQKSMERKDVIISHETDTSEWRGCFSWPCFFLPFGKGMMIMIVVARRSHQRFWKWWMTRFSVLLPLFPPRAFRAPYFSIFLSCDLKRCNKKAARLSVKRWRFVSINCWS